MNVIEGAFQEKSFRLYTTKEQRETLRRVARVRGTTERVVASDLLHIALAQEVAYLEKLYGPNWGLEIA